MVLKERYQPSDKEATYLAKVQNGKYERDVITGLKKFMDGTIPQDMLGFYSQEELDAVKALDGTDRDVQARMPVKITRHYFEQAKNSVAIQTLVKASPKETYDLGEHITGSLKPAFLRSLNILCSMVCSFLFNTIKRDSSLFSAGYSANNSSGNSKLNLDLIFNGHL